MTHHSFSRFYLVLSRIINYCSAQAITLPRLTLWGVSPTACSLGHLLFHFFFFFASFAFLARLPGNQLCLHNLRINQFWGRGMVHPLCGFIALRDSLVISSCSAGFGFCPLILQTLVFQHSAAKAAHTSGVYSVIKSSKPKHLASYGYIFREEMPLSGLCLLFHWVSRDPLPPPTCTA